MTEQSSMIQKILNLLDSKGIDARRRASTLAEVLDIKYNSAKQKIDGKRKFSLEETKKIFSFFGETYGSFNTHNGVFIMNDLHVRCNIQAKNEATSPQDLQPGANYVYKKGSLYILNATPQEKTELDMYQVEKIDFLAPPKIAILDNESDILMLLSSVCSRYGIDTESFQNKDELIDGMHGNNFDCYILDWLLDYGETAESVLEVIRSNSDTVPVYILSGQVNQCELNISKAIINFNAELIEKPARPVLISSILRSNLFFND
ncbi:helix-turn-helix domain-containing protein [Erwinia papayae]|uniref:Helix-turn-helix domain-containing protein n=1 Tax=Erwinia papayae TaxID=206499 RepID=A0ABV3N6Y8_9GAMM